MKPQKNSILTVLATMVLVATPAMANQVSGQTTLNKALIASVPTTSAAVRTDACVGKRMSLSDDQLQKIATLKDQFLTNNGSAIQQIKSLKRELKSELTQKDIDRSQVMSTQDKINSVKGDLAKAKLQYRLDFISVLTPEQQAQMRHRMLLGEAFGHKGMRKFGHGGRFERGRRGGERAESKA